MSEIFEDVENIYNFLVELNQMRNLSYFKTRINKYLNEEERRYFYKHFSEYMSSVIWDRCDLYNVKVNLSNDLQFYAIAYKAYHQLDINVLAKSKLEPKPQPKPQPKHQPKSQPKKLLKSKARIVGGRNIGKNYLLNKIENNTKKSRKIKKKSKFKMIKSLEIIDVQLKEREKILTKKIDFLCS